VGTLLCLLFFAKSDTHAFPSPLDSQTPANFGGCVVACSLRLELRAYLDGDGFNHKTIHRMGIAFEMAMGSLGATSRCDDPLRTALAHNIIALTKTGKREPPERMCEAALKAVRLELP
jgi:hypothetical protein